MVPNIGTIGLGIAKAGADIITLSGFEGGTGAARQHALRHVGLPSDIGTRAVHRALMEAGIRNRVEIWADGGYRHAHDIVKLHLHGRQPGRASAPWRWSRSAARSAAAASSTPATSASPPRSRPSSRPQEHGLKKFTPQTRRAAAESCARFFRRWARRSSAVVAELGYERAQDLVGRYDLLEQVSHTRATRPRRADHPARGVPRPRADRPARSPARRRWSRPAPRPAWSAPGRSGWSPSRPRREIASARRRRLRRRPACASSSRAPTDAHDRVLGTELAGAIARARIYDGAPEGTATTCSPSSASTAARVAGQGFGAFNAWGVVVRVEGGAQDGVGKTMLGGTVSILKGKNADGKRVNGSVGKSFAYGAQRGRLFVQGSADSRFCIRLSGADVVLAGEPEEPLDDSRGCVVDRANAKGFAFEYMTSGRAVVLGDIGPWACAGMTGGRVYVRHQPRVEPRPRGDRAPARRGRQGELEELDAEGLLDVEDLLGHYADELRATDQDEEAERVLAPRRRRQRELPDDHPGEGPGRPEHLDGVARPSPTSTRSSGRTSRPRSSRASARGICSCSQQKGLFKGGAVAIGVTERRLLLAELDRRGNPRRTSAVDPAGGHRRRQRPRTPAAAGPIGPWRSWTRGRPELG